MSHEVDSLLATLRDLPALSAEVVSVWLGVLFVEEAEYPSFQLYRGRGIDGVAGFELRAPREGARFGGLLIVDLEPGRLPLADLQGALGGAAPLSFGANPLPSGGPAEATAYQTYRLGRYELTATFHWSAPGDPVESLTLAPPARRTPQRFARPA